MTDRLATQGAFALAPRRSLSPAGDGDALANINTQPLADGASCYVIASRALFRLNKSSVTPPDGINVIQPIAGPGRWLIEVNPGAGIQVEDESGTVLPARPLLQTVGMHPIDTGSAIQLDLGQHDARDYPSISAAAAANPNSTIVIVGAQTLDADIADPTVTLKWKEGTNLTIDTDRTIAGRCDFSEGGVVSIDASVTLTIGGLVDALPEQTIFLCATADPTKYWVDQGNVILQASQRVGVRWFQSAADPGLADAVAIGLALASVANGSTIWFPAGTYDVTGYDVSTDPLPAGHFGIWDLYGHNGLTLQWEDDALIDASGVNATLFEARGCYHTTFRNARLIGNFQSNLVTTNGLNFIRTDNQNNTETPASHTFTWPIGEIGANTIIVTFASPLDNCDYDLGISIALAGGAAVGSDVVVSFQRAQTGFQLTVEVPPGAQNVITYKIAFKNETAYLDVQDCVCENFGGNLIRVGPSTREWTVTNCRVDGCYQGVEIIGTQLPTDTNLLNRRRIVQYGKLMHCTILGSSRSARTDNPFVTGSDDLIDIGGSTWDIEIANCVIQNVGNDPIYGNTSAGHGVVFQDGPSDFSYVDIRRIRIHHTTMMGLGGSDFYDRGFGAVGVRMFYGGVVQELMVDNCTLRECRNAIYWETGRGGGGTLLNSQAYDNVILGCRRGAQFISAANLPAAILSCSFSRNTIIDSVSTLEDLFFGNNAIAMVNCENARIEDNTIQSTVDGTYNTHAYLYLLTNCTYVRNMHINGLTGVTEMVKLDTCTSCRISANRFVDAPASAGGIAVPDAPATALSTDNELFDNTLRGGTGELYIFAAYHTSIVQAMATLMLGTEPPATGSWFRGDVIINSLATGAGKAGWICVAPGTPGLWLPFGAIDPVTFPFATQWLAAWDAETGVALAGSTVTAWTDRDQGVILAPTNGPQFGNTLYNGTQKGIRLEAASVQYFTNDAFAAALSGNDIPLTIVAQLECVSIPAVASIFWSQNALDNAKRRNWYMVSGSFQAQKGDGAITSSAFLPAPTTNPNVLLLTDSGTSLNQYIDNIESVSNPQANDVGAISVDQFRVGNDTGAGGYLADYVLRFIGFLPFVPTASERGQLVAYLLNR